jgi:hypothetical protein
MIHDHPPSLPAKAQAPRGDKRAGEKNSYQNPSRRRKKRKKEEGKREKGGRRKRGWPPPKKKERKRGEDSMLKTKPASPLLLS